MNYLLILTILHTVGASVTAIPVAGEGSCHAAGKAWTAVLNPDASNTKKAAFYLCVENKK